MLLLAATKSLPQFFLWLGGIIVLLTVAGLAIMALRRSMLAKNAGREAEAGLFESLRKMRDSGSITPQEYEAARRKMVARASGRDSGPAGPALAATKKEARPAAPPAAAGGAEVRARPGFDLTGRPLPKPESPPGNKE